MEQPTIEQRVSDLEDWRDMRDNSWLLNKNLIKQAFAAWGLTYLAQLIVIVAVFAIYFCIMLAIPILNSSGGH